MRCDAGVGRDNHIKTAICDRIETVGEGDPGVARKRQTGALETTLIGLENGQPRPMPRRQSNGVRGQRPMTNLKNPQRPVHRPLVGQSVKKARREDRRPQRPSAIRPSKDSIADSLIEAISVSPRVKASMTRAGARGEQKLG